MGANSFCRFSCLRLILIPAFLLIPFYVTAQITFERTYGGVEEDAGCSVRQTGDGGYILVGYTQSFGAGNFDVCVVKTDSLGDSVWMRTYGGPADDWGYAIQQTQDGGYIIAGSMFSLMGRIWDVYMVKTDSLGDSLWARTYGGVDLDEAYSVQQTQDGGYILAGRTHSFGAGDGEVYIIKTDSLGDSVWARTYGGADWDGGRSVAQTQDGGYIVAGRTNSFGAGSADIYLIRTDSLGGSVWTRTYGGSSGDIGYSVQQTQDRGYIVAGCTWSFGAGSGDVYLIKTDSIGETIWTRTYGGISVDLGSSAQQTEDGGYVIVGVTVSFGAGSGDIYLIRTDQNGLTGVEDTDTGSAVSPPVCELLLNHPNPFHHSTMISFSLPAATQVTLSIYDITGRLVETLVNETQQPGIHQINWNRKGNPSGVYFYRLKAWKTVETRKMVVVE
jgi:hypothetical protein